MKQFLLHLIFCLLTIQLSAQDIIITTTNERIEVIISEITEDEVEYKIWNNLNGNSYRLELRYISHIRFANGEVYEVNPSSDNISNEAQPDENTPLPTWDDGEMENYTIVLKTGKEIVFHAGTPLEVINNNIYYGAEELTVKEYKDLLRQTCPTAYHYEKQAKTYENITMALVIPALVFMGYGTYLMVSANLKDDDKTGHTAWKIYDGIGLGITLLAIPFISKYEKLTEKARATFNNSCAWKHSRTAHPELSLNFTGTNVGLTLKF